MPENPEDDVVRWIDDMLSAEDVDAWIDTQVARGPVDDYNVNRYDRCSRCGRDWHGEPRDRCPGGGEPRRSGRVRGTVERLLEAPPWMSRYAQQMIEAAPRFVAVQPPRAFGMSDIDAMRGGFHPQGQISGHSPALASVLRSRFLDRYTRIIILGCGPNGMVSMMSAHLMVAETSMAAREAYVWVDGSLVRPEQATYTMPPGPSFLRLSTPNEVNWATGGEPVSINVVELNVVPGKLCIFAVGRDGATELCCVDPEWVELDMTVEDDYSLGDPHRTFRAPRERYTIKFPVKWEAMDRLVPDVPAAWRPEQEV